ncbi:FkbM family methyltransferase [Brachyspira aalborgi]|uniref:FkbM family methyltransferase n=1 Tax=Brachyspira aalborgi TaxID=29522 RepID=A0A5C8D402_9SPIR|nr:FkbM family methyltransferase [Brachyspira aalborgi]TXJ19828.1 FkbM family methyltransferase [Brachyspira aalborgi]
MTSKTIDNIVWFIPFRKLRDNIRDYMNFIYNLNKPLKAWDGATHFRKEIKNDANFYQKYLNLIKNLDKESVEIVIGILSKITNYNNIEDDIYFSHKESKRLNDLYEEFNNKIIKINEELFIYDKYILPKNQFEFEAFYGKYGMDYVKNLNQVKNKNIIDAGGYIGDSAIVFSDYTDKNVYSFEPFLQNYNLMLKTIELNKKNNIIPVNMALGNENKEISIYSNSDTANSGLSVETKQSDINSFENKVKMVTLDSYVKENNIEVGLIKTDLEGFEQPFLKGAIETIKEQKPVLIISIYHNYSDFFEIKPMLENLNLGYKFRIIKNRLNKVIAENKLLAEV